MAQQNRSVASTQPWRTLHVVEIVGKNASPTRTREVVLEYSSWTRSRIKLAVPTPQCLAKGKGRVDGVKRGLEMDVCNVLRATEFAL